MFIYDNQEISYYDFTNEYDENICSAVINYLDNQCFYSDYASDGDCHYCDETHQTSFSFNLIIDDDSYTITIFKCIECEAVMIDVD